MSCTADTTSMCCHVGRGERKFALHGGPFVKGLEEALQSFNVHRQHYFGGVFVSHHIHKTLQVRMHNYQVRLLLLILFSLKTSSVCTPPCSSKVPCTCNSSNRGMHKINKDPHPARQIYDSNFIEEVQCRELGTFLTFL